MRRAAILVLAVGLVASATRVEAQVTSAQVQQSIDRGIQYLRRHQRADGSWPYMNYRQGGTALATYSLLLAGVPPADPAIEKAIRYLKVQPLQFTYSVALVALALTEADPQEHLLTIQKCAEWLQGAQLANGMWTYGRAGHRGNGDNSNTQFAVLGLWAAERAGVRVDPEVWRKISKHFHETQDQDGAWGYGGNKGEASRYSMTAAGLGSLLIAHHRLLRPGEDCGEVFVDKHIAAGLSWMEARGARIPRNLYDLYGLERVGMLSNQSVVAGIDWYRDGAAHLVGQQQGDGSWFQYTQEVGTSLALLFLAKGRAPLVVSKMRFVPGGEESRVGEVEELVGFASAVFGRKMTWQTVDWQTPLERTLLAPILFLNHHEPIDLTEPQLEVLRKFVASGGTIVANACCEDFDLSFRKAMARAFPGRDLERLGYAHPIYGSPPESVGDYPGTHRRPSPLAPARGLETMRNPGTQE